MAIFIVPVLLDVKNDDDFHWLMYVEKEIEAESYEEAEAIALAHIPASGPSEQHPALLTIVRANKWNSN